MKLMIIMLLFILNINTLKAYENEYFSIDIPDNYKMNINEKGMYKWIKDDNYIAITISNNDKNYDIYSFTKEDIENQKKYIEDNINKELKDYDIKVSVTDIKKIIINNKDALNYKIYWPTLNSTGYDTYQIGNIFTTTNYITTIVYSSSSNIDENSEYYNIIDTFKVKDTKLISPNKYITSALAATITLIIIRKIMKYRKTKTSHK